METLEYLGYKVDATGISPLPRKLQAIVEYPEPAKAKHLLGFLGAINYYRRALSGIKDENGVKNIQLKNSFADNPDEQGKVKKQFNLNFQYLFILNFDKMSIIYRMTGA